MSSQNIPSTPRQFFAKIYEDNNICDSKTSRNCSPEQNNIEGQLSYDERLYSNHDNLNSPASSSSEEFLTNEVPEEVIPMYGSSVKASLNPYHSAAPGPAVWNTMPCQQQLFLQQLHWNLLHQFSFPSSAFLGQSHIIAAAGTNSSMTKRHRYDVSTCNNMNMNLNLNLNNSTASGSSSSSSAGPTMVLPPAFSNYRKKF